MAIVNLHGIITLDNQITLRIGELKCPNAFSGFTSVTKHLLRGKEIIIFLFKLFTYISRGRCCRDKRFEAETACQEHDSCI